MYLHTYSFVHILLFKFLPFPSVLRYVRIYNTLDVLEYKTRIMGKF